MISIFAYFNYELTDDQIQTRINRLVEFSQSVGVHFQHLRYNLPDKFITEDIILKFALPHFFVDGNSETVLSINLKKLTDDVILTEDYMNSEIFTVIDKKDFLDGSRNI